MITGSRRLLRVDQTLIAPVSNHRPRFTVNRRGNRSGRCKVVAHRARRYHIMGSPLFQTASVPPCWHEAAGRAGRGRAGRASSAMTQPDAPQQAAARLDAAVDELESFL